MIITFTLCLFTFAWAEFISQMAGKINKKKREIVS